VPTYPRAGVMTWGAIASGPFWDVSVDSGTARAHQHAAGQGRTRPIRILRDDIDTFGVAPGGQIFSSDRGHIIASTAISDVWPGARTRALTPHQAASPLAGRPYDLRHAAMSLWLNAGVPATEVAERAGHSVEILLRVYARCLDGGEGTASKRIEVALDVAADACVPRAASALAGRSTARISARPGCGHPAYIPRTTASSRSQRRLAAWT
jgi:hypothetical protein